MSRSNPRLARPQTATTGATGEETTPLPPRGGHSEEYDVALAASVLVLRAALDAHLTLLTLDPENCRSRIANRYAAATLRLDRKVEEALRP